MRSTMLPGTMRDVVIPTLEKLSGKQAGEDFGVCINPEFLREGTAVHDYYHPPKTVIGEVNRASGDLLAALYASMPGPLIRTDIETAEMVKYADNCWHALKVGFANEIGNLCKALGVDAHKVMDIFCQDHEAQPLAVLPEARLRLRRLLPAEGPARAALQGEDARRAAADPLVGAAEQPAADRARRAGGGREGHNEGRHPRLLASRPAPTTCARARWWSSPSG